MAYKNIDEFISALEKAGELVRIKEYVNPDLEITEIVDRVSKKYGPALLFENTGTDFPLLINSMGNYKRICIALGVQNLDDIARDIENLLKMIKPGDTWIDKLKLLPKLSKIASWMPKVKKGKGECQEVIITEPDLFKLPIMKCWPEDGGKFITLPVVHTKDPDTGIRNIGMYRMQVFEKNLTGMHWHLHKVSARHFRRYKELGKKMPVAVAIGGDPVYTYAATAPMPDNMDEYMLAGFIRKKRVELVKCITQPEIEVPADADFIIEGYVDSNEDFIWEGPFGDHTGYYSLADWYPKFHVTAITHRKKAVYCSTIVGIPPQEDAWIGKATERIFVAPIKMTMVPEIIDMTLPIEGVFHNMAIIKIKKEYPAQAQKVMNTLWGAGQMMFTKMMIVVDEHCDIYDTKALAKYVSENTDPFQDIIFAQGPVDVLDHSCSKPNFGGKMGIDATKKFEVERRENVPTLNNWQKLQASAALRIIDIRNQFPEITEINDSLLSMGISLVFISIKKERKNHVKEVVEKLFARDDFKGVKCLCFLDPDVDIMQIPETVWRFSNNLDPKRDAVFISDADFGQIAFDATRKTLAIDGFKRDWPNIVTSNKETIEKIDALWNKLGLSDSYKESPSRKFLPKLYEGGAVAKEK